MYIYVYIYIYIYTYIYICIYIYIFNGLRQCRRPFLVCMRYRSAPRQSTFRESRFCIIEALQTTWPEGANGNKEVFVSPKETFRYSSFVIRYLLFGLFEHGVSHARCWKGRRISRRNIKLLMQIPSPCLESSGASQL